MTNPVFPNRTFEFPPHTPEQAEELKRMKEIAFAAEERMSQSSKWKKKMVHPTVEEEAARAYVHAAENDRDLESAIITLLYYTDDSGQLVHPMPPETHIIAEWVKQQPGGIKAMFDLWARSKEGSVNDDL
ncbi:hypothetical protein ACQCSV_13590 [Pseudarthrobacter sp. S3]|uniref:hypothetical protein n=1 Tax=Pseudarthrobacter sp. S3 TaxID=3418419 RepID=UPI003CEA9539